MSLWAYGTTTGTILFNAFNRTGNSMQFWDTIIHTALLGTDKKPVSPEALTPALAIVAEKIIQLPGSKEEQFLQIAAVALNYRQAGVTVSPKEGVTTIKAEAEEKACCPPLATQALKDILSEESIPLLVHWLQVCQQHKKLVEPALLPVILQTAVTQKMLQPYIIDCGGKRAAWLSQFNTDWKFSTGSSHEELWQTGEPEQRRQLIRQIRKAAPATALAWIQQTWTQEDAGTKTDFLKILALGIGEKDIAFLESLSTEKSKKVKEEAQVLLKRIPSSSIVLQYQEIVLQSLLLIKEKALLGLMRKTWLQCSLVAAVDHAIFKTGIEKLSNNKEFTDEEFVLYQLMQFVPLSFYEKNWQLKPDEIIQLFQNDATGKKLLPALILSIVNFSDERWAIFFMQYCTVFYTDLIPLLPVQQQEYYSIKFFADQPETIIHYAAQREQEWSTALAALIVKQASKNPYQYNRAFFNQHIHLIPADTAAELDKFAPAEEHLRTMWSNTSSSIIKLLSLKTQTIRAFNQ